MRFRSHFFGLPTALTVWCCLLATLPGVHAGNANFAQRELLADAADGRLDRFPLLDAAVIAGGIENESEIAEARRRLESLWLEVGEPLIARLAPHDRPRSIFSATHRLVLTGKYRAECTEVQRTLDSGDYNCVTASLLYLELCRRHGIDGVAVAIPGHVYCRLSGSGKESSLNIQTTCREWFEVREGKATGAAADTLAKQIASQAVQPRELTDVQLLGKVYYNRGVSQLEAHDYPGAIELLRISITLDPEDAPAKNNLLAAHNNWALALCDSGDHATAAAKLAQGRAIDADYGPLRTNDLYVHQKWVLNLCERGRYSTAIELLDQGFERQPEAPLFEGGRFAVVGMWARTLLESNRVREALAVLQSARGRYGDHEELLKQEVQAFEAGIARLKSKGESAGAQEMLAIARKRHPEAESLRGLKVE